MTFRLTQNPLSEKSDALIIFLPKGKALPREVVALDRASGGMISTALKTEDFKGELLETMLLYPGRSLDRLGMTLSRILLVGLGDPVKLTLLHWQRAVGTAVLTAQSKRLTAISLIVPSAVKKFGAPQVARALAVGAATATYQFAEYKTDDKEVFPQIKEIALAGLPATVKPDLEEGHMVGESVNFTRNLGNLPPNVLTPSFMAREAQKLAKEFPAIRVTVFDRKQMEKLGMGCVLGVSKGSHEAPAFIILEYRGQLQTKRGQTQKGPIVFAGKGITFDSGGISIKPSDKMDEMKFDMLGAGAVLGAFRAIALLKLKTHIVGLLPCTENLPGGSAYRPGDILRAYNGKTVEVLNTDAEGRLILADALSYAAKYKPCAVVDLATLTGAIVVALGSPYAGLMGNDEKLVRRVREAGEASGDRVWQLPLTEEYSKEVKSEVADVKNITGTREAGSITAAAFLKEFVSYPWAHIDIAATAWNTRSQAWMRGGATGFGVGLIVELVKRF